MKKIITGTKKASSGGTARKAVELNFYDPDIVDIIDGLVQKHEILPSLLQLEMTESAYMDNPLMIKQIVRDLRNRCFVILMDDFGSGYSFLSILKDVEVDILKIDMQFFEDTKISGKGENIIASIVRMAKCAGFPQRSMRVRTYRNNELAAETIIVWYWNSLIIIGSLQFNVSNKWLLISIEWN